MKSSISISPGWIGSINSVSVVVDEFDIFRSSFFPNEANAPLDVHPDTVLSTTVASQSLQAIPRWNSQVFHVFRRMDQLKLSQRRPLHGPINALDVLLLPDALGVLTAERSDHPTSV
jgi:hypothetical protein